MESSGTSENEEPPFPLQEMPRFPAHRPLRCIGTSRSLATAGTDLLSPFCRLTCYLYFKEQGAEKLSKLAETEDFLFEE